MSNAPRYFLLKVFGLAVFVVCIMTAAASFTPKNFPVGSQVHIPKNTSLSQAADILVQKHIVSSPFLFKLLTTVLYGQGSVSAGDYLFSEPQNLLVIVRRLANGEQGLTPIRVTIPEGSTVNDIAWILLKKIPDFNAPLFVELAHGYEGYLFPDTYVFNPNKTAPEILAAMRALFDQKLRTFSADINASERSTKDIIIMASLLEKEAASSTDRAIISGILWKRLDAGMPLQVDATIVYLTGRGYVYLDDLKIDSPYNTYKYKGLPKGPIANPGIDALTAALHPKKTSYYYYLSDSKGNMHYSTTFEGHQANRAKYLGK